MLYIAHQWTSGDCGLSWLQKHWSGGVNSLPSLYLGGGGSETAETTVRAAAATPDGRQ